MTTKIIFLYTGTGYRPLQNQGFTLDFDGTGYIMTHEYGAKFYFENDGKLKDVKNPETSVFFSDAASVVLLSAGARVAVAVVFARFDSAPLRPRSQPDTPTPTRLATKAVVNHVLYQAVFTPVISPLLPFSAILVVPGSLYTSSKWNSPPG